MIAHISQLDILRELSWNEHPSSVLVSIVLSYNSTKGKKKFDDRKSSISVPYIHIIRLLMNTLTINESFLATQVQFL